MSTHGFLWPYSISGLIRKYIDSITAWWQANWGEEGEKGQHIFENVNLNNVFWVCWKKPLSNAIWVQQHQASFSPSPSLFSLSDGNRYNMFNTVGLTFLLSGVVICQVISVYWVMSVLCTATCHAPKICFAVLTALLPYFLFVSPRMWLCSCSYWRNFKCIEVLQIHSEQITCTSQRLLILSLVIKNSLKLKCSFA